jgi:hypothetical protein
MSIALAIAAVALLALGYALGHRAGVAEHRALMRTAAAEWRDCWLGDPPKASQMKAEGGGRRAEGKPCTIR